MKLRIGTKTFLVETFEEASRVYQAERDASGKGASEFPIGRLSAGLDHYVVSYNGRVWSARFAEKTPSLVCEAA